MENSNSKKFNGRSKKKRKRKKKKQNKANKYSDSAFKQSTCVQVIVLQEYLPNLFYGKLVGFICNLFISVLNIWMN